MTPQYQRQLDYIFNRPTDEPAWYWRTDSWEEGVFNDNTNDAFIFLETLFLSAGQDLKPYSDDQIGLGLNFIFNNSCSNMTHDFKAADVPFDRKIKALNNLFALFRDVLNPRCPEVLSAFSQATLSKLNFICYMFWDVSPLSSAYGLSFTEAKSKTKAEEKPYKLSKLENYNYYAAIANVMERCLYLSSPACVESGLHGLGHMVYDYPKIAVPIIDNFLKKSKSKNGDLINYAKMARTGVIQ
jgi:hypothetical protein